MGLCISVCPTLFSALQCTLRGRGQCETRAHASHFLLRLDVAGQLQLPDLEVSDGPDQSWQGPDTSSGATKVVDFPMKRNSGVWMKTCCSGSTKSFLRLSLFNTCHHYIITSFLHQHLISHDPGLVVHGACHDDGVLVCVGGELHHAGQIPGV